MAIKTTAHYPENPPEGFKQKIEEDIKKFGYHNTQWMFNFAPIQRLIADEIEKNPTNVGIFIQLVFHLVYEISSKDVLPPHNICARETISEIESIKFDKVDTEAVNMLAVELLKFCNKIADAILTGEDGRKYEPLLNENGEAFILKLEKNENIPKTELEKDGFLWLDKLLLDKISKIGAEGRKALKELKITWKQKYSTFLETENPNVSDLFNMWISKEESWLPKFLKLGCEILWKDIVKPNLQWQKGKHASLARAVCNDTIIPHLSGRTKLDIDKKKKEIKTYNTDGKILTTIANIDISIFPLALEGMKKFQSITGHKLLRWQIERGFNNWKNRFADPRLVIIDGGYGTLCEMIGCPNTARYRQTLKSILTAQSHGTFYFPDGSKGNMISYRELEYHRNGEASKIEIIIGGALMPDYANLIENARDRRLIPITRLPKLVGDRATHAAQATLQLTVYKEFSDRSKEFAEQGAIIITEQRWKELSIESGLDQSKVIPVIDTWCEYDFYHQFLDKSKDQFTIAKPFEDAKNFLLDQGKYRKKKSDKNKKWRKVGEAKKKKKT